VALKQPNNSLDAVNSGTTARASYRSSVKTKFQH